MSEHDLPWARDHTWQEALEIHRPGIFVGSKTIACHCGWRSADSSEHAAWVEHVTAVVGAPSGDDPDQSRIRDEKWRAALEMHRFTVYAPQGAGCTCHWISRFKGLPSWSARQYLSGAVIDWTIHVRHSLGPSLSSDDTYAIPAK
jgi:hypothetical protein